MENPNVTDEMAALTVLACECLKSIEAGNKSVEEIREAVANLAVKCAKLGKETMMNAVKTIFDEMKERYRVAM